MEVYILTSPGNDALPSQSQIPGGEQMKISLTTALTLSLCLGTLTLACAKTFHNPQVDGYGLDYCREWAQNCGKPAADAFCKSKGYPGGAVNFTIVKDNQKTRVINGGQVCDAPYCDRINKVTCRPITKVFNNPQVDGYGLDYCREWAQNCGKPAADAFCQSKGYRGAVNFTTVKDNQKTRVINGGQVCDANYCDRINKVVCRK